MAVVVVLATIILARAFEARRPPGLKPWHRFVPPSEVRAAEMTASFTLEEYLAARRPGLPGSPGADRGPPGSRGPHQRQPLLRGQRLEPAALSAGLEPHLRDGSRGDPGRRASGPRLDRLSLQHAALRGDPARPGFLRPRPARAGPRHRARRAHGGHLAGLARGRSRGRAPRAPPRRRPEAARSGRLLQRGGALGQVLARRPGRREPARRPTGSSSCRR